MAENDKPTEESLRPEAGHSSHSREASISSIESAAAPSAQSVVMNALATIVASYGLLQNSAAVLIGAMIIAMLLGPIMGLGLAIVDGDGALLKRAFLAEIAGACLVLAIAAAIGRIHADVPITAEILARTKPNLLDLVVALAGGAAGAYATVHPKLSAGLVGVAISTALVPPLAACGICLSRGLVDLAGGAFILFATNLVAIQCASSVVFFAFGYHKVIQRKHGKRSFIGKLAIDAALFISLAAFLYFQLTSVVQQQQFEESVKTHLRTGLLKIPGAYLAETRFVEEKHTDVVVAVVRVPNSITPSQTAKLQSDLKARRGRRLELRVRSLLTKETTSQGYLNQIQPQAQPIDEIPNSDAQTSSPGAETQSDEPQNPAIGLKHSTSSGPADAVGQTH